MAYNLPGLKASTGMKTFEPLVDGDYELECVKCEVKDPKNPSPTDVWTFTFNVAGGPAQADGKPAKGKRYMEFVNIMRPEHPSFRQEWLDPKSGQTQMGVDQLKSMMPAMGVTAKGDNLNPDAFAGTTCRCHITVEIGKNDGKPRNRGRAWTAAE